MDLNYFKDILFDLLNESDELNVNNIYADDPNNTFTIITEDGTAFEILCRQVTHKIPEEEDAD